MDSPVLQGKAAPPASRQPPVDSITRWRTSYQEIKPIGIHSGQYGCPPSPSACPSRSLTTGVPAGHASSTAGGSRSSLRRRSRGRRALTRPTSSSAINPAGGLSSHRSRRGSSRRAGDFSHRHAGRSYPAENAGGCHRQTVPSIGAPGPATGSCAVASGFIPRKYRAAQAMRAKEPRDSSPAGRNHAQHGRGRHKPLRAAGCPSRLRLVSAIACTRSVRIMPPFPSAHYRSISRRRGRCVAG